jgi:hypothetical protein
MPHPPAVGGVFLVDELEPGWVDHKLGGHQELQGYGTNGYLWFMSNDNATGMDEVNLVATGIDAQRLYPRLSVDRQHAIYRRDLGRHMMRMEAAPVDAEAQKVLVPMLEDLCVQFVQDREKGFEWVTEGARSGEEIWDDVALIQQAFRNLKENLGEDISLNVLENGLIRVVSGGKYEASFLLLSNLWLQLEVDYGAEMYAAVPSANLLLVGRADDRRAILELQDMIRGVFFEADTESLLSKAVYQRVDGQWQVVATAF